MQATIENLSQVQRKITIAVPPEKVSGAFEKCLKDLQKKAQIRGFRPGKAPLAMIKQIYGRGVGNDVANALIQDTLFDYLEENNIRATGRPEVREVSEVKEGSPFEYTAYVDVFPDMSGLNYSGLNVEVSDFQVRPQDVEAEIHRIKYTDATPVVLPSDAIAEWGHTANVEVKVKAADAEPTEGETANGEINLGVQAAELNKDAEQSGAWIKPAEVVGLQCGQTKTYTIERKTADGKGFKNWNVTIALQSLEKRDLSEISQEVLKKYNVTSEAELKTHIHDQMARSMQSLKRNEIETGLYKALVEREQFEVPSSVVANILEEMIDQNRKLTDAQKRKLKADEEYKRGMISEATNQARWFIACGEVVRRENIEVTESLFDEYCLEQFGQVFGAGKSVEESAEKTAEFKKRMMDDMRGVLINRAAVNAMVAKANVKTKSVGV